MIEVVQQFCYHDVVEGNSDD